MALASGEYVTKDTKTVHVWPAPSHDGDGELVYETEYDTNGTPLGEVVVRDRHDRELRYWSAPEGFANKPGYDHTDNYVLVDKRGAVVRAPNGEAYVIRPGEALVVAADGSYERLSGEKAQRAFEAAHEKVSADTAVEETSTQDTPVVDDDEDRRLFEEWKKNR